MNSTGSAMLNLIVGASGAFFGAFFAFMFGLATYYWTKWVERQNKDYDAMVKLEGVLNEHLNTTSRDQYLIHNSILTLDSGGVTYNILRKYRIIEDLELSFLDLDLINQYFEYKDSVNSLNNDFEVGNKANDILREAVIDGKANQATITTNSKIIARNLIALSKMLMGIDDETQSLLCLIRIKIQEDKPGFIGIHRLFWQPYKPRGKELAKEMTKLKKEIAETKEKSTKKISDNLAK